MFFLATTDSERLNHRLTDLDETAGGVRLCSPTPPDATADLVIGADGLHSRVRTIPFVPKRLARGVERHRERNRCDLFAPLADTGEHERAERSRDDLAGTRRVVGQRDRGRQRIAGLHLDTEAAGRFSRSRLREARNTGDCSDHEQNDARAVSVSPSAARSIGQVLGKSPHIRPYQVAGRARARNRSPSMRCADYATARRENHRHAARRHPRTGLSDVRSRLGETAARAGRVWR